jgi:hypothetical protein
MSHIEKVEKKRKAGINQLRKFVGGKAKGQDQTDKEKFPKKESIDYILYKYLNGGK